MKKWITLILIVLPLILAASFTVNVNVPQWNLTDRGPDGKLPLLMKPGNPALRYYPVRVLVPMGEAVTDVQVALNQDRNVRTGINLNMVLTPQIISQPGPDNTVKNPAVWNANAPYPVQDFEFLGTQTWKGYTIAVVNIYPWHYNPVTQELSYSATAEVTINTQRDDNLRLAEDEKLVVNSRMQNLLAKSVVNPQQSASYIKTSNHTPQFRDIDPNAPKQLIIITSQNKLEWFGQYIQWKNTRNMPTGIFAIEDILAEYPGVDNPDKLRNFINDAYTTWSSTATPLEYVILAGDDEIIPIRGVSGVVGDTIDEWMPCDLYYGCLDGTWNADNDNLWGEYPADNPDLLPEVYVGRFPAETQAEFDNIIRKTMYYVNNPTWSNNIATFYGENLNWNPVTWGGDYKDDVAQYLPTEYHFNTHYQRDGTYTPEIVWSSINDGIAIMNHMGHANQTFLMGQGNGTIEALQNTEYGFLYSQGCYPAAFDQRTSGDGESIAEHMLTASGGMHAFIGNTRYGWYMPGSVDGPSEYFDRQFFNGMFQQGLFDFGQSMEYSLLQNLNSAMQEPVMLWCYYETILFGDPSTQVKLPNPDLPCLTLDSYAYDDVEGDGDGNLNPGEAIRLYPRVRNLPGWNTAYNVFISTTDMPAGVTLTNCHIAVPALPSGALADTTQFIRFELSSDIPFGTYNFHIRLVCYDQTTGLIVCERRFPATMSITLLDSHFPWDFFYAGKSAPVVGDLQFNDTKQILFVDVNGDGHFINRFGENVGSFDFSTEENINRSFASGIYEAVNTPMRSYAFTSRTGRIYAIAHKDSTTLNIIDYDTGSSCVFTPVIADLDNNGYSDVIASATNKRLYALDYNNDLLPGFPVELSASYSCELAVADIDGDGYKEIIAGTADGKLWIIRHDGTIQTGYPIQLQGSVTGSPLILDNNKIVAGTRNHLYVINPDGTVYTDRTIEGDMAGGAIPVDINRDGTLDIVFVTTGGALYACNQDGSDLYSFPVQTGSFFNCPPLAADVDSDHQYEIILQSNLNSVFIYNNTGSAVSGFPFGMNYNGSTPATLTDLDGDGNYELVEGYSNGVLVIKLRRALGNLDAWTVYRGGDARQGSFAATGFVANDDETAITQVLLGSAYPNPFNPETTLSFALPKAENNVTLTIYNSKGQKVKTVYSGNADKGTHSLIWSGKDDNNIPVGSGIYFYMLTTSKGHLTRKMVLLK
jgi:hypothetical protein